MEQATDLLGWPIGTAIASEREDYRIRNQALKIFENNADTYQTIRNLFHANGRYVRLLGNHDDSWRSDKYLPGLQVMYPGLEVFDYVFLGNYGDNPHDHGGISPQTIVAHGHQIDGWNNSACRGAGEAMTELASGLPLDFPRGAASVTYRSDWEERLNGLGFGNKLSEDIIGVNEVEFYDSVESDFSDQPYIPQFVLGHTHHALKDPEIPDWMSRPEWNFSEYTNCGTAGRWEQFIWCATVGTAGVGLYGWTWGADGKPKVYQFKGGYADFLRPVA